MVHTIHLTSNTLHKPEDIALRLESLNTKTSKNKNDRPKCAKRMNKALEASQKIESFTKKYFRRISHAKEFDFLNEIREGSPKKLNRVSGYDGDSETTDFTFKTESDQIYTVENGLIECERKSECVNDLIFSPQEFQFEPASTSECTSDIPINLNGSTPGYESDDEYPNHREPTPQNIISPNISLALEKLLQSCKTPLFSSQQSFKPPAFTPKPTSGNFQFNAHSNQRIHPEHRTKTVSFVDTAETTNGAHSFLPTYSQYKAVPTKTMNHSTPATKFFSTMNDCPYSDAIDHFEESPSDRSISDDLATHYQKSPDTSFDIEET